MPTSTIVFDALLITLGVGAFLWSGNRTARSFAWRRCTTSSPQPDFL